MIKNLLKKTLLLGLTAISYLPFQSFAQTTVNYTSDSTMSDAMVGNGGVENSNFGLQNQMNVYHQLNQQIPMAFRSFIQYDLSAIPANAIITEAKLKLTTQTVDNAINHPIYVERVDTAQWTEGTITWNNQPSVHTSDQLSFTHAQTSGSGVQEFEVTDHVQKMIANPNINNGWRIRLQSESGISDFGIMYHSSEAGNTVKRPILSIEYILPIEMVTTVEHCTAGNDDGTLTISVIGGSSYSLSDMHFFLINRDTTAIGETNVYSYKGAGNLSYNAGTRIVSADNLEPGIYLFYMYDPNYYVNSDRRFHFYKHILVGREGETTSGILHPYNLYAEDVFIEKDKPTNTNSIDRANANYSNYYGLYISNNPNIQEQKAYIKYNIDFDDQIEFSKAELQIDNAGYFFQSALSSNAGKYSFVTSPWEENSVTWNTQPSIDTTLYIDIIETDLVGVDTVHIRDTVSLLPFVERWQQDPGQNYGFEMALADYASIYYSRRSYRGTEPNRNIIEFEFSVKEAVSATYDYDTQRGEVIVNAPTDSPLPYKYLISYNPLPELSTIWTAIKDSIPIDSATFYAGDVQSTSFTFEDLDAERYYVGVYDNNGTKILDGQANVTPELTLLDNSNVDLTNGVLTKGQNGATGSAIIDGMLLPNQSGGFEFEVTAIGGNMVIGFNDQSQSKSITTADFEYSFELFNDNTFSVLKSDSILFTDTVEVGDIFRITKQNYEIVYNLNEFELHREEIPADERISMTGGVLFRTPTVAISRTVKLDYFKPITLPIKTTIYQMECGEQNGSITIYPSFPMFFGGTGTYAIRDINLGTTIFSGLLGGDFISYLIPAGEYKIEYNYTVGGVTYIWVEYFSIGYKIEWNILNDDFVLDLGTVNTIEASNSLDLGLAISQNAFPQPESGWAFVHVNFIKYYVPLGDYLPFLPNKTRTLIVNQDLETQIQVNHHTLGAGIINKYISVKDADGVSAGSTISTYLDAPVKIRRVEAPAWTYEVIFNNNAIPFATVLEDPAADETDVYYVFAKATNAAIHDSYASTCAYPLDRSYADLTKKLDGGYYLAENGIVKFIYNEEYNDQDDQLTYTIFDAMRSESVTDATLAQAVVYGDNRYDLNFSSFTGDIVLENGVYVLEVKNEKNEKWYLRFKIINN